MFNWIWEKIKLLGKTIKTRIFLAIGFVFTWLFPIYLLNQQIALTETDIAWKLTFGGLVVAVFALIKFYSKIGEQIDKIEPKTAPVLTVQLVLVVLHKAITLGGLAWLLVFLESFISQLREWWFASLIVITIGLICYLIDRVIVYNKKKAEALQDREDLKEEIRQELNNGE